MYRFYIISYSGTGASKIKEDIKTFGAWFNHFDNQFLLCTKSTIDEIKSILDKNIAQGTDKLLIMEVSIKDVKGWLNDKGWDWIKKQREKIK